MRFVFRMRATSVLLLIPVLTAVCAWGVMEARKNLRDSLERRDSLRRELTSALATPAVSASGDFSAAWPHPSQAAQAVRDMARYAKAHDVRLSSQTIQRQPATDRAVGYERYNIILLGTYPNVKLWLLEMLQRHPSLAVEGISVRSVANDAGRQEANLNLVLYLRREP